jgi:hypothetical protein
VSSFITTGHSSGSIRRRFGSTAPAFRQRLMFALPVSIDLPDRRIGIAEKLWIRIARLV